MRFHTLVVGYLETNCYILADGAGEAAVIDPGGGADRILREIDKNQYRPRAIILTHTHADHTGGLDGLRRDWDVPVLLHTKEADFLRVPADKRRRYRQDATVPGFHTLEEFDKIAVGILRLKVLSTPGHTPGGICLLYENDVFTGDTLFEDGVGRTDFPGGSQGDLLLSIRSKLMTLPDETRVHPGHGPSTTIGRERGNF